MTTTTQRTISTDVLTRWLQRGMDVALFDVLPADGFRQQHIAGAANVPVGAPDFVDRVLAHVGGNKERPIVVYSGSPNCTASPTAATKLTAAGFRSVYDYEPGIEGWLAAGHPLVGTRTLS